MSDSVPSSAATPYLLLFRNAGEESHAHLTDAEREKLTRAWNDWYERLAAQGRVKGASPLALGGRVIAGARGEMVKDGPFAEAKEVVGGYFILLARDLDEATEFARGCPGLPIGLSVEIREIVGASPVLKGVQGHADPEAEGR
jgi:Uncharacterized protein conserved in bacteria